MNLSPEWQFVVDKYLTNHWSHSNVLNLENIFSLKSKQQNTSISNDRFYIYGKLNKLSYSKKSKRSKFVIIELMEIISRWLVELKQQ